MTLAYWTVLIAAFMPVMWVGVAKFSGGRFGPKDNLNPREYLEKLDGWRKRAYWAQNNAFEAFPPYAAAVIIAHLQAVPQATLDTLAMAFIALRFLHGVCYLANWGLPRTAVWTGATGIVIALFVLSAG